jgi:hypothetical protein
MQSSGGGGGEEEEYATIATQARVMFNERSFLLFPFLLYFFVGKEKEGKIQNPNSPPQKKRSVLVMDAATHAIRGR